MAHSSGKYSIRLDDEMRARVDHHAVQLGCSVSEAMRDLLRDALATSKPTLSESERAAITDIRRRSFQAVASALRDLEGQLEAEVAEEMVKGYRHR